MILSEESQNLPEKASYFISNIDDATAKAAISQVVCLQKVWNQFFT